ncbi:MAG TPA: ACP phosphodiesterase [Chitinophagaceae bacterium]
MNFLAHAYLSFGEPDILAGNIFSDFVKGKKRFDYPKHIQYGISLHRAIDEFTDNHEATAKAKQFFRPAYGLYAAPFTDIVYDHFLAKDASVFSGDELKKFSATTYEELQKFEELFPPAFSTVFYYMKMHDWLYNYQFKEGIFQSFRGLVRRASFMDDAQPACDLFLLHYEELQLCYEEFFPQVKAFAFDYLYSTMRNLA